MRAPPRRRGAQPATRSCRPGSAGTCLRKIAEAGANLELVYVATATRLVIGTDDLDAARAALS
jgi:hypothetical protein